jgi:hypothetical protein
VTWRCPCRPSAGRACSTTGIECGVYQPGDRIELIGGELIVREAAADTSLASPVLIVEAAESSLPLDREIKSSLHARAQIVDYWIVDLVDHVLEVYRDPVAAPATPYGWRYASVSTS